MINKTLQHDASCLINYEYQISQFKFLFRMEEAKTETVRQSKLDLYTD